MIIAMSVQTTYSFVDAIWVSGLGPDALSAVGFFFPFFFMIIALATRLGVACVNLLICSGHGSAGHMVGHRDRKYHRRDCRLQLGTIFDQKVERLFRSEFNYYH
ncbi:MAG: hypothetical protein JSU64_06590 [candidate division WOR-3 bacterium]|nr:MAG: hypothetical protein JSU64_06590 [candidate division WOR-3 bacterium]